MPQFSSEPPADPRGMSLELKRCPPGAVLAGIITCPDVVGCPTHFWGGRTQPHEEQDCEPCLNGIGWLWHGYVSVYQTQLKNHFLFEMTARCTEPLTEYRKLNDSLRGCSLIAQRPSGKPNGRVHLKTKTIDVAMVSLPKSPDLRKVLAMIWNIPLPNISAAPPIKGHPAIAVDTKANGQQWQPNTSNDQPPSTPDVAGDGNGRSVAEKLKRF